ncbi:MAG: FAD binding domain-containing protein [Oscillospiraceae bacterium]|nr:FAD binding domain-containing protein [Oscillospiraceae bacterium]
MLTIRQYVRARSLEEAYTLCQKRGNVVLGGMAWLKMQTRSVVTAIDLCDLKLDTIEETETAFSIGAMTPLRALETHEGLNALSRGAVAESLKGIVGVQFRNTATVGGSVYARFGFSDVTTLLLALGARVELYKGGVMSLEDFNALPRKQRDILVRVIVPKREMKIAYRSQRNTKTDLPVLTCAVAGGEGEALAVVGARPAIAQVFRDETGILKNGVTEESAAAFGAWVAEQADFGSNSRAGGEYRRRVCAVLVRRCAMAWKEG